MMKHRPLLSVLLFFPSTFLVLSVTGCNGFSPEIVRSPSARVTARPNGTVFPLVTGTDGSNTGIAPFVGNYTVILQPTGMDFALVRQPDCSLNLYTGSLTTTSAFTITSSVPHYDAVLRRLALLTTPAGTYPRGCPEKSTGISTRAGVFAGRTTQGLGVFVQAGDNSDNYQLIDVVVKADVSSATMNRITTLPNAGRVATADIDGDGNGDLVVTNYPFATNASVSVLLGNADGSFKTPVTYFTPGARSVSALIDDVNGDGKLDLVVASDTQQISILTGNGDGTFNAAQSFAATYPGTPPTTAGIVNMMTVDLRSTGNKDIVCSNGLVLLNNGNGTFTVSATPAFPYPNISNAVTPLLASGDFNKDGKPDIVVSNGYSVLTWLGKGDGTFNRGNGYAGINNTGYVTVSDLDGDGNDDIYTGLANGGLYSGDSRNLGTGLVLLGNGNDTFQGASQGTFNYNGHNLADLNGDGQPDLVTLAVASSASAPPSFIVHLGSPNGAFQPGATIATPATFVNQGRTYSTANTSVTSYAVADINGDGRPDLVYLLTGLYSPINGPFFFVALGNGDGTFGTPAAFDFPTLAPAGSFDVNLAVDGLQITDFDHDGKADLLFTFSEQQSTPGSSNQPYLQGFAVLPGVGNGTFNAPVITLTYNSSVPTVLFPPEVANIADVNSDNKPDLFVIARNGSAVAGFGSELRLYLGSGDGSFASPSVLSTGTDVGRNRNLSVLASPCVLVDLNKDGKLDLACLAETSATQAQILVSLGNGNGTFAPQNVLNVAGGDTIISSSLAAADFDADGNVDLALLDANTFSGIFYGKSDGTFTSVPYGNLIPKDLLNLYATGAAIASDLNKDGKPDLLVGSTVFLNTVAPLISTTVPSVTTLTALPAAVTFGQSVTLTATVTGTAGVATGTVTFTDSLNGGTATTLGTGTLNASGVATLSSATLATGSHAIIATYGSSGAYNTSASAASTVVVSAVPPVASATTLVAAPTSITTGQSVAFTATVTGAAGIASGTVTFSDSLNGAAATTLGTGNLNASGVATLSSTTLGIGSHVITAMYGGSAAYNSSVSTTATVDVSAPPPVATATSLTALPTSITVGQSVALTATTTAAAVIPGGTVTFMDSLGGSAATSIGTGTLNASGVATLSTTTLAAGSHSITAVYSGSASFLKSTSAAVTLTVAAVAVSDFSLSLNPTSGAVQPGTTATTTVTVTPINGFSQAVSFACTGLPVTVSCSFSPATVTPAGAAASTVLTFTRLATGSIAMPRSRDWSLALVLFGLVGFVKMRGKRRYLPLLGCFLLMAGGCGGSSPTPPVTSTVNVVATSGALTHSSSYTLTSQ